MRIVWFLVPASCLLASCSGDSDGLGPAPKPTGESSVAMRAWVPAAGDDCSRDVHDRYTTVGPDGKRYPTWHPPTDPSTGCSFGHEHGRDPRGSDLFGRVGDIPFGYANEQLDVWDPNGRRHEDHVGHKVDWENDVEFRSGGGLGAFFSITCDVLVKLHQGTHSKDAFTNNLHELVYHAACSDGTEMHITLMAAIGKPGEFVRSCDGTRVTAGSATPLNSPAGGGQRKIPDRSCIERHFLVSGGQSNFSAALHESWEIMAAVKRADGHTLASVNPYFQVFLPSRYHDLAAPNHTGRPMADCYQAEANGDRADGSLCRDATGNGAVVISWDDPRSPFNGVRRKVDINGNRVDNDAGPNVWYTDPFGRGGKTESFPGAVRQWIARHSNPPGVSFSGPAIGSDRNYAGAKTHAPN